MRSRVSRHITEGDTLLGHTGGRGKKCETQGLQFLLLDPSGVLAVFLSNFNRFRFSQARPTCTISRLLCPDAFFVFVLLH